VHELDAPALTGRPYERATGATSALLGVLRTVMKTEPVQPDTLLGGKDGKDGKATLPTRMLAYDHGQALASTEQVEALGYTLLLPGHGEPVRAQRAAAPPAARQ
jgi:hypothetical protein